MHFEHFAINVADPPKMAAWYVAHCEMKVVFAMDAAPHTHFLADSTGRTVLEIYANPVAATPDYASQHSLILHHAFAVVDIDGERDRLLAAGATLIDEATLPDGTRLAMLRDPWGLCLQLCKRATLMPV